MHARCYIALLTEDKHIVKTKIYSLSIAVYIGYIINFCPIDRESEVPTDVNVKVDLSPQLLQKHSGSTKD
jgi:hypothetical protein